MARVWVLFYHTHDLSFSCKMKVQRRWGSLSKVELDGVDGVLWGHT